MEVQVIQARPQLVFAGNSGRCEDCEEEERQDALQEDITQDRVNLSQASLKLAENSNSGESNSGNAENDLTTENGDDENTGSQSAGPKTELQLSEEERRILNELKARDAEVRAHEAAHLAAAGPYANGAPTFEFQTGPDGRQYATGGEVSIDTSPVPGDPEATVRKAQTIKRAALAPREPSGQDRQVAAQAAQLEAQARQEAQAEKAEENDESRENNSEKTVKATNAQTENQATPDNNEESSTESPFTKRVKNQFTTSGGSTSGNLLNIIS
ncbi:MAG: hypothetical protein HOB18_05950 [Nitrospina sp.]|jgi:hypothetical protein|nr:hypothetical protein [Nitrospina sp.]